MNQVILGDALEVLRRLPDNAVDAVITDPPYSSGGQTMSARAQDPVAKYQQSGQKLTRPSFPGDSKDGWSWLHWCALWIAECHRVTKPGGYFLMFSDWRQLPAATDALQFGDYVWRGLISWDKGGGARAPHKGYFRHQCEYLVWGTKGGCPKAEHSGPYPGCYHHPVLQRDKYHLTGKPTALLEQLVAIVPEGAVILDPFAGSGTLAVAAKRKNRNFIAIEKVPENIKISKKRLIGG